MHISPQKIDRHVQDVTHDKDHPEKDEADHASPKHAAHGVDHRTDHARGKSQRQKPGVGQHIGQPA